MRKLLYLNAVFLAAVSSGCVVVLVLMSIKDTAQVSEPRLWVRVLELTVAGVSALIGIISAIYAARKVL